MNELLIFTAKYLYLIVGIIAFIYWLTVSKQEKIRLIVFGVVAVIVTFVLVKVGAALYYDPRPFVTHNVVPIYPHSPDNGFPSDHTVLTAFIAFTIFSSSKRLGVFLLVLSALIGLSRVVGHIHSPIDIVGSFVFALIGFGVATWATPYIIKRLKLSGEHDSKNAT